jgi:predicted  nucleic acid-binding Zn-ribbon protein
LQEIDKGLQALEDAKEQYPAEISDRRQEIERAEKSLETCTQGLAQLGVEQRRLERELDDAKQRLKDHEARFAEVTNNREYDALQIEIDVCRTRIAECEAQIIDAIDRSEALQQETDEERARCEEVSSTERTRIEELEQKLASLEQEVDRTAARRRFCTQTLEAGALRLYERIRRKRGTRVAPVRKGACGGCFRELPAQHRSNVRRNERAYFCESCGALLVWDGDST